MSDLIERDAQLSFITILTRAQFKLLGKGAGKVFFLPTSLMRKVKFVPVPSIIDLK